MDALQEKQFPILSRRQIEGLIADGRSIVIVDGKVLKVDAWLPYHPGGELAIRHMVGKDATDEINALHSKDAMLQMNRYQIGRIVGQWRHFTPPIRGGIYRPSVASPPGGDVYEQVEDNSSDSTDASRPPSPLFDNVQDSSTLRNRTGHFERARASSVSSVSSVGERESDGLSHLDVLTREEIKLDLNKYPLLDDSTQNEITRQYRILHDTIRSQGLFKCSYSAYGIEAARYAALFCTMLFFLRLGWYGTSGVFMGAFWHQIAFTVHDAGHMGITHDFTIDSVIGILLADFLGGLSLGWWKRSHNVHHIITNSPEHDPDIEHMPFFAVSHRLLESLWSTYHEKIMYFDDFAKFLIARQAYLYYPVMTLGRYNLYVQSWIYLICGLGPKKGPAWWLRWLEMAGQVFFWAWFGYGLLYRSIPSAYDRFVFIMVSHAVTMALHVQITLSHFAMSTADLGPNESFPQRMLRTTMDVDCPQWLDFFHGGLQFQAVHHLFPRIPRHNLRNTQKLVQKFCSDVGIPYALYGFVDGNRQVVSKLGDVARQAAILAKCQKVMAESGEILHGH